jgi:hypothetical protein
MQALSAHEKIDRGQQKREEGHPTRAVAGAFKLLFVEDA